MRRKLQKIIDLDKRRLFECNNGRKHFIVPSEHFTMNCQHLIYLFERTNSLVYIKLIVATVKIGEEVLSFLMAQSIKIPLMTLME